MDISTLGSCVSIVAICYVVVGMGVIPDFPATDYITAVAVGMFNGLSATGVNQVIKQTVQKE